MFCTFLLQLREITGITDEGDDFMNHQTDTVSETRPDASQNLEGLTACMICQVNVAANDPTGDSIDGMKDKTLYTPTEDMRRVKSLLTQEWSSILTPQILSKWWNCMVNEASCQSTTQAGICNIYVPGERKFRQHLDHMRYQNLKGTWYSNAFFMKITLVRQHMCGQIITNCLGLGFNIPYPLPRKGDSSLGFD